MRRIIVRCPTCSTVVEVDRGVEIHHARPVSFNDRIAIQRHYNVGWRMKRKTVVARELGITVGDIEWVCQWIREGQYDGQGAVQIRDKEGIE